MRAIKVLAIALACVAAGASLLAAAQNNSVLIRNVTIHPMTAPVIQNGSVLVIDGKIADIGPRLAARGGTPSYSPENGMGTSAGPAGRCSRRTCIWR